MVDVVPSEQEGLARRVRAWLATHRDAEDLINIGAYAAGSSAAIDEAVARLPAITAFLRQPLDEPATLAESVAALATLAG
jgi:flagellum-specific ATP synthase